MQAKIKFASIVLTKSQLERSWWQNALFGAVTSPKILKLCVHDLLALERNFSLEQAAAATQLLVLHYAPVQLERAHMPRPLIRLAQKKVADAISAFNLLRRL